MMTNAFKSPGPDGIPNWILRDMASFIAEPVSTIFNTSISQGEVPAVWKQAIVIPIPKVQPPKSIEDDLRPISLTATLAKHLEWFIGQQILSVVSSKLDHQQFGALKGRSTTHALLDMTHRWLQALDNGESIRAVFVDFAKAFDHVDHGLVIERLVEFGVPSYVIRWIYAFLKNRQQRVRIGKFLSQWLTLNGGMPQGTWLGPIIFVILIDALRLHCLTHKFVDDTTLSEFLRRGETSGLDGIVRELLNWTVANNMKLNGKKTKEIILGPLQKAPPPQLVIDGTAVERVASFKLLGIHISSNMKWDAHVEFVCAKSASRLHFLKRMKRACSNTGDLVCFYTTVIRPVLEYACPVWHSSLTKKLTIQLESQQIRAMRIIFGDISYDEALDIAGIPSLEDRRQSITWKFFLSVLQPNNCLHNLLPAKRNQDSISRLRLARTYPLFKCRTERFKKSFFPAAISKFDG